MHTLVIAVAIGVVATEKDICLVAVDNLCVPANGLTSWRFTKVLLVDLRGVAPAEDVITSLATDGNGLVQSLPDVCALGGIAGPVDRILIDSASVPSRSGGGSSSLSDGDCCLTRSKRTGKGSRSSKEHKGGDTSNHFCNFGGYEA